MDYTNLNNDILPDIEYAEALLDLRPILLRVAMADLCDFDSADELVQITMIDLYKYGVKPRNIEAYAVAALKRNIGKAKKRNTNIIFIEDMPNGTDIIADTSEADTYSQEHYDMLDEAMAMIDESKRDMLTRRVIDNDKIKDIARNNHCSIAKVKKDIAKAKSEIRNIMNEMKKRNE